LRKYLIVAIAALTAMVFTTAAIAQTPAATMKVKVAPKKAGTKKKPKNSSINLSIANADSKKTLRELTITSPATFKLSAKGFKKCNEQELSLKQDISVCGKKTRVGKGTAHALVGVTGTTPPFPLTFKVTAVVLGAKKLGFFLDGQELDVNVLAPATIKGRNLIVTVPDAAQQPSPGLWAGLVDLQTTMKAKQGKNMLAATTGCKAKKMKFGATLKFANNTGAGAPADIKVSATSKCSK
jgi:hypothetical protein